MAFSIVGILAVLLEAFRPLIPLLIAVVVLDIVLLAYTISKHQFAHAKARRLSLWAGAAFMVVAFLIGPSLTQVTFGSFLSATDWVMLALMAFGVGVAGFILTLPMTSLLKY